MFPAYRHIDENKDDLYLCRPIDLPGSKEDNGLHVTTTQRVTMTFISLCSSRNLVTSYMCSTKCCINGRLYCGRLVLNY